MNILDTFALTGTQYAAATLDKDLAVSAGAGSGKTNTLTARFVRLADQNETPHRIVAVTFTDKATREMRNRIRTRVREWVDNQCPREQLEHWRAIQSGLDAARIGTIHSLCAEILRAHPAEAEIDPRFGVLDEGLASALKVQVVQDSLAWATGQHDLTPLFGTFDPGTLESMLSNLLNHRLEAETAFAVEVSGNVTLCSAIREFLDQQQVGEAWTVLRELQDSGTLFDDAGDKLGPQVETLLVQWDALERALAEARAGDAALVLFKIRREGLSLRAGSNKSEAKKAVRILQTVYDESIDPWLGGKTSTDTPPDPALDTKISETLAQLRRLFNHADLAYQQAKAQRAELDFDDMERGAQMLLRRPEIRAHWQARLDALLVDEFQDTNERQREIIEALAGSEEGRVGRLFIVGDPKQSIYRFRGADVTVFGRVRRDMQARGGEPIELMETFRAHTALIELLNHLLAHIMGAPASRPGYYTPFAALKSSRKEAPRLSEPFVELLYGMGEDARQTAAQLLAERLLELHEQDKLGWDKMVCLFRASSGFDEYERAFAAAGIPFVTVAGRGFYERPEIRDLLNLLRAFADPSDDAAMAGLLRSPAFGLSDAALYQLRRAADHKTRPYVQALTADLAGLSETDRARAERAQRCLEKCAPLVGRISVAELLKTILQETNYLALLSAVTGERLQRNVEKLLADAYDSGMTNVSEFLEYIETLRDVGARESEAPSEAEGAVRLMTVHKAKGLQFPVVILADAARGVPNLRAPVLLSNEMGVVPDIESNEGRSPLFGLAKHYERDRSRAEDLRLLYVAATRAQEKLIVCAHASQKTSPEVWFHQLANAAEFTPGDETLEPHVWHEKALTDKQIKIAYKAGTGPRTRTASKPTVTAESERVTGALFAPLSPPRELEITDERSLLELLERDDRAARTGELFHLAIRQWTFPGEPNFEMLLRAGAANFTLSIDVTSRVRQLLDRLRGDPRWQEINDAPVRRQELPFAFASEGLVAGGVMDLIYQTPEGKWLIVDFKTDAVTRAEAENHVRRKYRAQLLRYLAAAKQIGLEASGWVCFVDCEGGIDWQMVT